MCDTEGTDSYVCKQSCNKATPNEYLGQWILEIKKQQREAKFFFFFFLEKIVLYGHCCTENEAKIFFPKEKKNP